MSAEDTVTVTVPSWVEHIALPEYPAMPILAFVMLGFGTLLLLIGYFAPIKKIPSLLTALALLAYYPLAFTFYWFLFRFDEQKRALREHTKFEEFLLDHTHAFEWAILGVCAFFAFLFFVWTVWATVRKYRRRRPREIVSESSPFAAQPAVPQAAARPRPAAPRPAAAPEVPQVRKVAKKPPPPPPSDNPFNFS
ncbi:MAG TPA: hypothetical protein VH643_06390 [Gemmataceae bacterium]|jgi:hypothetical protein